MELAACHIVVAFLSCCGTSFAESSRDVPQTAQGELELEPIVAAQDTFMTGAAPTAYHGADVTLECFAAQGIASRSIPLLRFPLSSIPDGYRVANARVRLVNASGSYGAPIIRMTYVIREWTDEANWRTSDGIDPWGQGGASEHDVDIGVLPAVPTWHVTITSGYVNVSSDLSSQVNEAVALGFANYDLRPTNFSTTASSLVFHSVEATIEANRPRLLLTVVERGPGDIDGDGRVDVIDLLAVLVAWGSCSGCPADLNGDGLVSIQDLLIVLSNWSP